LWIIWDELPRHGFQRGIVRNAKLDEEMFHGTEKVGMVVIASFEQLDRFGITIRTPSFVEFKDNVTLRRAAFHERDLVIIIHVALRHGRVVFLDFFCLARDR
jgi:hypothetical protein